MPEEVDLDEESRRRHRRATPPPPPPRPEPQGPRMLDRTFVAEVKHASDIVAVVQRYLPLKKQGERFIGLCPFHEEKHPSFGVTPKLAIFKCFG